MKLFFTSQWKRGLMVFSQLIDFMIEWIDISIFKQGKKHFFNKRKGGCLKFGDTTKFGPCWIKAFQRGNRVATYHCFHNKLQGKVPLVL